MKLIWNFYTHRRTEYHSGSPFASSKFELTSAKYKKSIPKWRSRTNLDDQRGEDIVCKLKKTLYGLLGFKQMDISIEIGKRSKEFGKMIDKDIYQRLIKENLDFCQILNQILHL